jgi:hypothetical protein
MPQSHRSFLVLFFKKEPLSLPSNTRKAGNLLTAYPDIGQRPIGQPGELSRGSALGAPVLQPAENGRENASMGVRARNGRLPGKNQIPEFAQRHRAGNLVMVKFSHDTHL